MPLRDVIAFISLMNEALKPYLAAINGREAGAERMVNLSIKSRRDEDGLLSN